MRMPNKEDDVLLQTLRFGVNTSTRAQFEKQLYARVHKQEDAESCFLLALYHCMLIPHITDGQNLHKCLMDTLEWSSKTIEKEADHWCALFLRSTVRLLMNDDSDEVASYLLPIDYSEDDAVDDINRMIELQKLLLLPSPYCTVPYVQLAYVKILDNNMEGALNILKEASDYIVLEEIPYFGDMLSLPFVKIYKKAYEIHNYELLKLLKNWIMILFPNINFRAKGKK